MAESYAPQQTNYYNTDPVKNTTTAAIPGAGITCHAAPAPHPHKAPRYILLALAICVAVGCFACQAIFMNAKETLQIPNPFAIISSNSSIMATPPSSSDPPKPPTSAAGRKLLSRPRPSAVTTRHTHTTTTTAAAAHATAINAIPHISTTGLLASAVRHLTQAAQPTSNGGSSATPSTDPFDALRKMPTLVLKLQGKQAAKAPGVVLAAAVVAVIVAVFLAASSHYSIWLESPGGAVTEVVMAALVLVLWLAALGCSASTADVLRRAEVSQKDLPEEYHWIPKKWVACNALALTGGTLSVLLWGAILTIAVLALRAVLRANTQKSAGTAATPIVHAV